MGGPFGTLLASRTVPQLLHDQLRYISEVQESVRVPHRYWPAMRCDGARPRAPGVQRAVRVVSPHKNAHRSVVAAFSPADTG
eukprot:6179850-Pleurochrysis_carterae.AAC.4